MVAIVMQIKLPLTQIRLTTTNNILKYEEIGISNKKINHSQGIVLT